MKLKLKVAGPQTIRAVARRIRSIRLMQTIFSNRGNLNANAKENENHANKERRESEKTKKMSLIEKLNWRTRKGSWSVESFPAHC